MTGGMLFCDKTLATLAENLALDEALLLHAEAGGPEVLRIWQWRRHAVVLGAGGRIADDVHEDACAADGVPIFRRSSGGGTVLLGSGCLLYSLTLRFDRDPALTDLHASYRFIFERMLHALRPLAPSLAHQGSSDLTLGERKCSGNSQQRKRTHLLHHGTLLHAFDTTAVSRYLKIPPRQPDYRQQREHADFLINLPIREEELCEALRDVWQGDERLVAWPADLVKQLVWERYENTQWIRRR
jgi:lipoate-protein ligase A